MKTSRKIIYLAFLLIFLIATPLILLYTSGYRYNFQKGRVQKTGIIIISTVPKKAQIILNGNLVENKTTPTEIKNALPGDYEIILTKEGYHNWDKKLPVYENATTFAEKVILWKNSQPQLLNQAPISSWSKSTDGKEVAFIDNAGGLYLFSLTDNSFNLLSTSTKGATINWAPSSKKILLSSSDKQSFQIYNIENGNGQKPLAISGLTNLRWQQNSDSYLYGLNEAGVWKIDSNSGAKELIAKINGLSDFSIINSDLYTVNNQKVIRQDIKNLANKQLLAQITNNDYRFLNEEFNFIELKNNSGQIVLIDESGNIKPLEFNAKEIQWLNKDVLLYYNDFEISIYDFNKGESRIITRVSQPITEALWHPLGKHIIFSSGGNINIIELDDRELRNVITLADSVDVGHMELSGENLYFSGTWKNQKGIFKLNLQ